MNILKKSLINEEFINIQDILSPNNGPWLKRHIKFINLVQFAKVQKMKLSPTHIKWLEDFIKK